ncbi:polygalacturonase-like [Henckelia pumila]|uniref:polygalacturonase-like n=1 Tax=Henckelia pumila TaxID=405737 RepID=UPI003C6DCF36
MIQILILTIFHFSPSSSAANKVYNVMSFGAKPDSETDCANAFLSAWGAACSTRQPATIYVPPGRYLLGNIRFDGASCKNNATTIRIDGTLVAPLNYNVIGDTDSWVKFESVTGVSIYGGALDGRGNGLWACKNSGKTCPQGATSLLFHNSKKIMVNGLTSTNSQMFHILLDGCHDVEFVNMKISAPGNSPNTDGIHVQQSSGVTIANSHIGTGDDCISIGPGNSNVWIDSLACGPGHGISIGSLGWDMEEAGVENVTVKTVTLTGTENGLRVKTWARPSNGFVRNVLFQHIVMVNVQNPIIIDQNYCPNDHNCPHQSSGVKISDVTYRDIHGTSATEVAIKFGCSKTYPCKGITLDQINLSHGDKTALASCTNALGTATGVVRPTSCF